jgi:hypothetical protein
VTITSARARDRSRLTKLTIPLASGAVGYYPDAVAVVRGTFTAGPASGASYERAIGSAIENYSQTAGDAVVQVELYRPVNIEWFANDGNIDITTDFLAKCYFSDARTVSKTSNGDGLYRAYAGQIWLVDAVRGVGVKVDEPDLADLLS